MSDLGEEFAKICISYGLKKHLYMRFDCIPPEYFPISETLKKILENSYSLTVRKKKKKKKKNLT